MADRVTFVLDENNLIIRKFELGLTGRKSKYGLKNHGKEVFEFLLEYLNSGSLE